MTESYLNGIITVTSLAAPTKKDLRLLDTLSKEERIALLREALERGENSETSDTTVDQVWDFALFKAKMKSKNNGDLKK